MVNHGRHVTIKHKTLDPSSVEHLPLPMDGTVHVQQEGDLPLAVEHSGLALDACHGGRTAFQLWCVDKSLLLWPQG